MGKARQDADTLKAFFDELGPDRCKLLENVSIDMSQAYIEAVKEKAPNAKIVFDRFQVQRQRANKPLYRGHLLNETLAASQAHGLRRSIDKNSGRNVVFQAACTRSRKMMGVRGHAAVMGFNVSRFRRRNGSASTSVRRRVGARPFERLAARSRGRRCPS